MIGSQPHGQDLPGAEKMPDICPGIIPANLAMALFIQRRHIRGIDRISDRQIPPRGEYPSIARYTGRQNRIKHIYPPAYRLQQNIGEPTYQIMGLFDGTRGLPLKTLYHFSCPDASPHAIRGNPF